MLDARQVPRYLEAALAAEDLASPDISDKGPHVLCEEAEVMAGDVGPEAAAALARAARSRTWPVEALVVPVAFRRAGGRGAPVAAMCVPCLVAEDGTLSADLDRRPWLPGPVSGLAEPAPGSVQVARPEAVAAFWAGKGAALASRAETWRHWLSLGASLWTLCIGDMAAIEGAELAERASEAGLEVDTQSRFLCPAPTGGATRAVRACYDAIEAAGEAGPVGTAWEAAMAEQGRRALQGPHRTCDGLAGSMARHSGHMAEGRPLAPSQREAVHCWSLDRTPTCAVSGPPGCGKTTLVQDVVATLLVRSVLAGEGAPVVVAAAPTNRAAENLLSSLASVPMPADPALGGRWLAAPDGEGGAADGWLEGVAAMSPAGAAREAAEASGALLSLARDDGAHADLADPLYLMDALPRFLDKCEALLGDRPASAAAAEEALAEGLRAVDAARLAAIEAARDGDGAALSAALADLDRLCALAPATASEVPAPEDGLRACLEALDAALDKGCRVREFWLALHACEARWLRLAGSGELLFDRGEARRLDPGNTQWLRALANACPVTVCTLHRLPSLLRRCDGSPSFGAADLVVVDEAGQATPALGMAALSFGARALVVGDDAQIPPVRGLDPASDEAVAASAGLDGDGFEELRARSLDASGSTLMAAARHASNWANGTPGGPCSEGLMLREHFRCVDEVASWCSENYYGGALEPMRGPAGEDWHRRYGAFLTSPMQFVEVKGGSSQRRAGSRANPAEAEAVAAWCAANLRAAVEASGAPADRALAVVAPFKAQADEVRRRLAGRTDPATGRPLSELVLCGTAHALQGSERPVVCYSCTYGPRDAAEFVNANPNLVNVAVSRAADALVVFGDRRWLRPERTVLGRLAPALTLLRPGDVAAAEAAPAASKGGAQATGAEPDSPALSWTRQAQAWAESHGREVPGGLGSARAANAALEAAGLVERVSGGWAPTEEGLALGIQRGSFRNQDGTEKPRTLFGPAAFGRALEALEAA